MKVYLIDDCYRVDGLSGRPIEQAHERDFVRYSHGIDLKTARNAFASFQIVVEAPEGLRDFDLSFTALECDGAPLTGDGFEAYIEWFHRFGGKLIPDLLVPLGRSSKPMRIPLDEDYVPDQTCGALWVDLHVPAGARPGIYSGRLTVTADGQSFGFAINVEVAQATVPEDSLIFSDVNNYADALSPHFSATKDNPSRYRDGTYFELERKYFALTREHRGVFHLLGYRHSGQILDTFAPELEGSGVDIRVKSWDLFDQHFGPYLDGSAFKGSRVSEKPIEFLYLPFHLGWPSSYENWGKKGYATENRRILAEFMRHFEEKGWDKTYVELFLNHKKDYRFYPYTVDEIWYEHDEEGALEYYEAIRGAYEHTRVKFRTRMDESNHYGNHYDGPIGKAYDFWVCASSFVPWYRGSVDYMKNMGHILFTYGGLPSLDQPHTSILLHFAQVFMLGMDGFVFWLGTGCGKSYLTAPGEGGSTTLIYPGTYFGLEEPLPSLRLKVTRNIVQTMDLLAMTRGMDDECVPVNRRARAAVNRCFGIDDDQNGWWKEPPPFVNDPPRIWDFGESFGRCVWQPPRMCTPCDIKELSAQTLDALKDF